jgi:hypothetical protein
MFKGKSISIFAAFSFITIFAFQNCSKSFFLASKGVIENSSFSSQSVLAETEMNTPVEFTLPHQGDLAGVKIDFAGANGVKINGTLEVIDAANFKIKYQPNFGFRGSEYVEVNLADVYGNKVQVYANISVGNPLSHLSPALAVRGMGCIQCHANVQSNIITDFGYKGNGQGQDYFFNQNQSGDWYKSGGIYGDHALTFNTMTLNSGQIIVPQANLPNKVGMEFKLATLTEYIESQMKASVNLGTMSTKVTTVNSIYIGAPTDSNLENAFQMTGNDRFKYFKNGANSVDLSGLQDKGNYFTIKNELSCDGDLVVRGPIYIENLNLTTNRGCRLYVIGSVFFYGELKYSNSDPDRNLQITSTKSILMGLGDVKKNNTYCELDVPTDPNKRNQWLRDNILLSDSNLTNDPPKTNGSYTSFSRNSSLYTRLVDMWTVPSFFVRQNSVPLDFGNSIVDEANIIQATEGQFLDASCPLASRESRNVSFERLLLNAPIIHSRYTGNFSGTVIAEYAIMSLNQFKFEFDEVFRRVSIFPFLDSKIYLDVQQ